MCNLWGHVSSSCSCLPVCMVNVLLLEFALDRGSCACSKAASEQGPPSYTPGGERYFLAPPKLLMYYTGLAHPNGRHTSGMIPWAGGASRADSRWLVTLRCVPLYGCTRAYSPLTRAGRKMRKIVSKYGERVRDMPGYLSS